MWVTCVIVVLFDFIWQTIELELWRFLCFTNYVFFFFFPRKLFVGGLDWSTTQGKALLLVILADVCSFKLLFFFSLPSDSACCFFSLSLLG